MAFASRRIAAQMRFVALVRFSNFFTDFRSSNGATPAKLFHVSTSRLAGDMPDRW